MRGNRIAGVLGLMVLAATSAVEAAPKYVYVYGNNVADLAAKDADFAIKNNDLINGLVPLANGDLANPAAPAPGYQPICSLPDPCLTMAQVLAGPHVGHQGFHPLYDNGSYGGVATQLAKLADGAEGVVMDGILADYMWPSSVFQYNLPAPTDIGEIRVFAANAHPGGYDARVFQDYDVEISTDTNPDPKQRVFTRLISEVLAVHTVCAGGSGGDGYYPKINKRDGTGEFVPPIGASLTRVFDDANPTLAAGVTSIRLTLYGVGNTQGMFIDRWLGGADCGVPAESVDPQDHDGLRRGFEGTIVKEIDVLAVRYEVFEQCSNTLDDDNDTLVDGDDPDCHGTRTICAPEVCDDSVDNNGNSLVDCDDPDCWEALICNMEICNNTLDDDGDGSTDCEDPDCAGFFPDCVCGAPRFDVDKDADVDQADFAVFQTCFTGPNPPAGTLADLPMECQCLDVTGALEVPDEAVDQNDLSRFEQCATGPGIPVADNACDGVTP